MRHFTGQTTEAKTPKFGLGVPYSIRIKTGIIKSVLIKAFVQKKIWKNLFFLYQLCILKSCFVFSPFQTDFDTSLKQFHTEILINGIIKTGKTLALTSRKAFPFI